VEQRKRERREKEREGGGVLLGFAKKKKERGCKDKWRGRVPCNGMHAHVTRWVIAKD
jgi:hypothetical protein